MAPFGRPSAADDRRAEQYKDWLHRRNPYAIASFVLGLFSLIEFGALIVFGLAGIALGVVALVQLRPVAGTPAAATVPESSIDSSDEVPVPRTRGHFLAVLGIVFSVLSLIVAALLYFRAFG
jgi:hypothetical protein